MKYDVFISSKSEDYPIAEGIYKFLTGKNYRAFLANKEIPNVGDAEYKNTIDEAIDQTRHLIVVASNASYANSKWVKYEWQLFANEKLSGRKPDGNLLTICADSVQIGNLPIGLRNYQSLPLSSYQETICQFLKNVLQEEEDDTEFQIENDRIRMFEGFQDDAPACSNCGSVMIRIGNCYLCHVCGSTSGCF